MDLNLTGGEETEYVNNYIFHHQAVSAIAVKTLWRLVTSEVAFSNVFFKIILEASLQKGEKKMLSLTYSCANFLLW